jgi:hypothetical protein
VHACAHIKETLISTHLGHSGLQEEVTPQRQELYWDLGEKSRSKVAKRRDWLMLREVKGRQWT